MPPLAAAAIVVLCEGLAFGAVLPVLPEHCRSLGGGALAAGVLFGLVSLPKVVTNPLLGRWSDRVGRRPALIVATLGTLCGSIGWALAPTLAWLALARAVTGVFGAQAGLAQAVAADGSPPERRAAAAGVLGAAFGVAFAFGPLIGGWVATRFDDFAVGWACAALQGLSLAVIVFGLAETRPAGDAEAQTSSWSALWAPGLPILLLVTLLFTISTSALFPTLPLVMADAHGFDRSQIGLGWAVFGIVGLVVQGGLIRPLVGFAGERTTSGVGLALLACGLLLLAFAGAVAMLWLAIVLTALGTALVTPSITGLLSRSVGPEFQGSLAGANQAVLGVGRFAGNLGGGGLYQRYGAGAAYAFAALLCVASLLLLARSRRMPTRTD